MVAKVGIVVVSMLLSLVCAQLPLLPTYYMTTIQGNINLSEKGKAVEMGVSVALSEAVQSEGKARLDYQFGKI